MRRLLFTLCTLMLLATPALADVVKTVSNEYYVVEGRNPKTIYLNLKRQSPLNEGYKTYQANTQTELKYNFKWRKRGNTCTLEKVTIFLHLTYKYPKLAHSVDNKTRKWWKKFMTKLEEHELIHGQISIKAAHELDDALRAFDYTDCINFKAELKKRATRIINKMMRAQKDYDKLTEHGLKQERNRGQYP